MEGTFLYDCRNVRNCFMCWNLRNREYCIKNVQYSKEDYHAELKKYRLSSREEFTSAQREFEARLRDDAIHRADFNVKCKDSTGNYLTECKQCRDCNFLEESENCAYMFRGFKDKDGRDGAGVLRGEITYNLNQVTDVYHLFHSNYCTNCRNSEYLDFCFECEDCFGCVGLRNQRFCILNKRYDEQAYHSLIAEIKKAMMADGSYGKFFPYRMACGGYNLSLAGVFFPKTEAEVKALQGLWEESGESGAEGRSVYEPPDDIAAVDDAAVGKALICTETKRAFSVTAEELAFLRKHGIPLPREYPDVRTLHRVQRLFCIVPNPTTCFSCKKNITSFYPPAWGYKKIYCNECYLKAVL
jgi:hypothetical protein